MVTVLFSMWFVCRQLRKHVYSDVLNVLWSRVCRLLCVCIYMKNRVLESVIDELSGSPVIWKRRERRVKLDVKHTLLPQVCVDVRLASVCLVLFDESCQ